MPLQSFLIRNVGSDISISFCITCNVMFTNVFYIPSYNNFISFYHWTAWLSKSISVKSIDLEMWNMLNYFEYVVHLCNVDSILSLPIFIYYL